MNVCSLFQGVNVLTVCWSKVCWAELSISPLMREGRCFVGSGKGNQSAQGR